MVYWIFKDTLDPVKTGGILHKVDEQRSALALILKELDDVVLILKELDDKFKALVTLLSRCMGFFPCGTTSLTHACIGLLDFKETLDPRKTVTLQKVYELLTALCPDPEG